MANQYTVKAGDTISGILKAMGNPNWYKPTEWAKVSGYGSGNVNLIRPGEVLTLPGGSPIKSNTTSTSTAKTPQPTTVTAPKVSEDVQGFLDEYQTKLNAVNKTTTDLPGEDYSPFGEELLADVSNLEAPEAPKLEEVFMNLRNEYGVTQIETELNELKALERDALARVRDRLDYAEGGQVALGVIGGRSSEIQRQEQKNLEFIQRQIQFRTDMLNSAYNIINTVVNLKNTDFNNAMKVYETEFNSRMKVAEFLFEGAKFQKQLEMDERDYQLELLKYEQGVAKANLETFANLIVSGSLDYNKLDGATKTMISKLEIQSGLGLGFLSKVKMPAGANIKGTSARTDPNGNKYIDVLTVDANGKMKIQSIYAGKEYVARSGGGGGLTAGQQIELAKEKEYKTDLSNMTKLLSSQMGKDGKVSPTSYINSKRQWVANGYSASLFDEQFYNYVNPTHWRDYGVDPKYFK